MMKVVYEDMVLFESDVQVMEMTNQGGTTDTERGKTTSEGERADTSFWIDEQERCHSFVMHLGKTNTKGADRSEAVTSGSDQSEGSTTGSSDTR